MPQQHLKFSIDGNPLLNEVCNQHKDHCGKRLNRGESWHTDHPNHRIPPKFTTLYCVTIPDRGGNTEVVNMRAGYEALPDDIKIRIRDMKSANVFQGSATRHKTAHAGLAQAERQPEPIVQPLVRTNPDNGTQALYFSRTKCENIIGMDPESTQVLLEDLVKRAIRPKFIYSHKWTPGDMLIWDNRAAMHQGVLDCPEDQVRQFYRVLIEGELPH
jgi:taurine dioxygenase